MAFVYKKLILMAVTGTVLGYTGRQKIELILKGLSDMTEETINGTVTVEHGRIPEWLNGNFIRHGCGVYGNTEYMNSSEPNYIEHLFDCIESGTKFKLKNGHVTFTNRLYDTLMNDFYNKYGRNMNQSSMFFAESFSKTNITQTQKWDAFVANSSKIPFVPHVSWWKVRGQAVAMTEGSPGVAIDPETVEQKGYVIYDDNNFGYGKDVILTNNPAHEHSEADGTIWSAVTALRRIVYTVDINGKRTIAGEHHYKDADLSKCSQKSISSPYPDMRSRFGYLHSFCMTEKYIILPEAGYLNDPCVYTHYNDDKPFFPQAFRFEHSGFSRLMVMRKSDGKFIANITTKPFFVTHQLGSYEENNLIHMDMLMYDDASLYTKSAFVKSLLQNNVFPTNVTRITIDTKTWTVSFKDLRSGPLETIEMPTINQAYNGKKYTYGYMVKNFDRADMNAIIKLNVDTGAEIHYAFSDGMFAQEPQFIPRPNLNTEDDGVLLVQGVDGIKNKDFSVRTSPKTVMRRTSRKYDSIQEQIVTCNTPCSKTA